MRILDDPIVGRLLPPPTATNCVDRAFDLLATEAAHDQPRQRSTLGTTTLNVMSAIAPTLDAVAVKSYPVVRADTNRASVVTVVVYSYATGQLRGLVQGDLLGQRRTAAATAIATRAMARQDSATACLFGTGYQGPAQITSLVEVLPQLQTVLVVGRSEQRASATASELRARHPHVRVEPGTSPADAVPRADVLITATTAIEPVFDGELIRPGTHINAVGSNHPEHRELDGATLRRAAHVVVDARAVAFRESGDLLTNGIDPQTVTEFASVHAGRVGGRADRDDITVFESHGLATQDLVCAIHVLDASAEAGLGMVLEPNEWHRTQDSTA